MKSILLLLILIFVSACEKNATVKEAKKTATEDFIASEEDTLPAQNTKEEADDYFDSLRNLKFDTSTLEGKAKAVLNDFTIEYCQRMMCPESDTLFDLNFDGYKDLVINYYGASGTGLKNIANVYFYNPKLKKFEENSLLSGIYNPSFYIEEKVITWFYIAHGGGDGGKFVWKKGKWQLQATYSFGHKKEEAEIIITDTKTNKSRTLYLKNYIMIPPDSVLKNKYEDL